MNDWVWYLILAAAGFVAGVINTIAGGGSFLTLPALMFFGLDPKVANATNRVAILFSTASATQTFQRKGLLDTRQTLRLATPTMLGVPIGSYLAIRLPSDAFETVFGILFLVMAVFLAMNPKRLLQSDQEAKLSPVLGTTVFLAIGIYVGFIQAGMGILLLLAMSWIGSGELLSSNATKNAIGFLVTLVALVSFAISGLIEWIPGLVMAGGNLLGGVTGAKLAIANGNRLIFTALIVVMLATGVKMIYGSL